MFLIGEITINNYEIIVILMFHSPKIQNIMSPNLAPILRRSVKVHSQSFSLRLTKYSYCITLILIFSLLKQQRWERIWLSPTLVQDSFYRSSLLLWVNSTTVSSCTLTVRQRSSLHNCFFYFQVGVFHQRPLINLQQINFILYCSLQPKLWISVTATRARRLVAPIKLLVRLLQ